MRKTILSLCAIILFLPTFSQSFHVEGKIVDSLSNSPISFANIVADDGHSGCISDINGNFSLKSEKKINYIILSYVGYVKDTVYIPQGKTYINATMSQSAIQLHEFVVLPGINPAHRFIDSVYAHRKDNDPFNLESFSYKSYNKFFVSMNVDSISENKTDTQTVAMKSFFDKHHLFFMESSTERKYKKPSSDNEIVLASKVSGFSNPLFTLLMNQIQPFSFYKDMICILDKNYINPISRGSKSKYLFLLQDTILEGNDSIFVIKYRPKIGTNFDGLKGVLYIHSSNWALQSVVAEPAISDEDFGVKFKQNYKQYDSKHWFPYQLNAEIFFNSLSINDAPVYGKNVCEFSEVKINPELRKKDFTDAAISISDDAEKKDSIYWNSIRPELLTEKEKNTYKLIDSLGEKHKFDKMLDFGLALMDSYIPIKFMSLNLNSIYDYNEVEGSRIGMELKTNEKISKRWSIGGFYAYGFKDKQHKFGGNLLIKAKPKKDFYISVKFAQDVRESGDTYFGNNNNGLLNLNNLRHYLFTRADHYQKFHVGTNFRVNRYLNLYPSINRTFLRSNDEILWGNYEQNNFAGTNSHVYTDITLFAEIDLGRQILNSADYSLTLNSETPFPKIQLQFQKAIPDLIGGELSFFSTNIRISQSIKTKYSGTFSYKIQSGKISNDVPLSLSYNAPAAYRQFTIASEYSFETMRMNEFYSTEYLFVFLRHSFNNINFGKSNFKPSPEITTSFGIGNYPDKSKIQTPQFKTLDHGYLESGIFINDLINLKFFTLGFGTVYRYGYYSLPETKMNFTYKISLKMIL